VNWGSPWIDRRIKPKGKNLVRLSLLNEEKSREAAYFTNLKSHNSLAAGSLKKKQFLVVVPSWFIERSAG
jgi:hypothetical protein